jgi:hypothetical protein
MYVQIIIIVITTKYFRFYIPAYGNKNEQNNTNNNPYTIFQTIFLRMDNPHICATKLWVVQHFNSHFTSKEATWQEICVKDYEEDIWRNTLLFSLLTSLNSCAYVGKHWYQLWETGEQVKNNVRISLSSVDVYVREIKYRGRTLHNLKHRCDNVIYAVCGIEAYLHVVRSEKLGPRIMFCSIRKHT